MSSKDYAEFVLDRFAEFGEFSLKRMFGGYGFYKNKVFVACIADGELYIKADHAIVEELSNYESQPFTYEAKGKKIIIKTFQSLPLEIFEDDINLERLLDRAYEISLIQKKKKNDK